MDSIKLKTIQYILVPSKYLDSLQQNKEYIITASPSTNIHYLAFSKILTLNKIDDYKFHHYYFYISGLSTCKDGKRDIFDKYIDNIFGK